MNGTGLIARRVRRLVGKNAGEVRDFSSRSERPQAIVEATGEPGKILDATRRVADRGTVVLVGETLGRRVQLNLYPDVHLRGLMLVGVSPPLQTGEAALVETPVDDLAIQWAGECLVRVEPGVPLPLDALWYLLSGRADR